MSAYLDWFVFAVLIISTLGTILPLLPGLPVMAAAIILYGWWENFQTVDQTLIIVTLILTGLGSLLDYFSGPYTAKKVGATKYGVVGALLGGVLGILVLGPIGLVAGPFIGAFAGELWGGQQLAQASKVGLASVLGTLAASLIKFAFALTILVMFFLRVIK